MKRYLILLSVLIFLACSAKTEEQEITSESQRATHSKKTISFYSFIHHNLYHDRSGNLYLKSHTREHFDTGKWIDVWLKTVYCPTCQTSTEDEWMASAELKDFVDVNSFHLDTTDSKQGGDFYEDKNYRYFHKWMADGGTISLTKKNTTN